MVSKFITRLGAFPHLGVKAPVKAVAESNILLSGLQTLQGYETLANDRVLVINQLDGAENGIYNANHEAWLRALDWNLDNDVVSGTLIMNDTDGFGYQIHFPEPNFILGTTAVMFRKVVFRSSLSTEFSPGYTYVNDDADSWHIAGLDVTNIFTVGRRLRFEEGANIVHGTITASVFTTDTDIDMSMEDGAVLPTTTGTDVYVVSSHTGWSPIADDPFKGNPINDVVAGKIGLEIYWVIVGDDGRLAYSVGGGLIWNVVATGTVQNLTGVAYDSANERFMAVGDAGVMLTSTDAVTWSLDTTTLPAYVSTGTADCSDVAYNSFDDIFWIAIDFDTRWDAAHTIDFGVNWVSHPEGTTPLVPMRWSKQTLSDRTNMYLGGLGRIEVYTKGGSLPSPGIASIGGNFTAMCAFLEGGGLFSWGASDFGNIAKNISGTLDSLDDVTFTQAIRGVAWSPNHQRLVTVGEQAQIGYVDRVNFGNLDAFTVVPNGFNVNTNINSVWRDDTDNLFIAVAQNGQISRSTTGLL